MRVEDAWMWWDWEGLKDVLLWTRFWLGAAVALSLCASLVVLHLQLRSMRRTLDRLVDLLETGAAVMGPLYRPGEEPGALEAPDTLYRLPGVPEPYEMAPEVPWERLRQQAPPPEPPLRAS